MSQEKIIENNDNKFSDFNNNVIENDKMDVKFYENELLKLINKSPIGYFNILIKLGVILDSGCVSNSTNVMPKDKLIQFLSKTNIQFLESSSFILMLNKGNSQGFFTAGLYEISKQWLTSNYNVKTFDLYDIQIKNIFKDQNLLELIKTFFDNSSNDNLKYDIRKKLESINFVHI